MGRFRRRRGEGRWEEVDGGEGEELMREMKKVDA